MAYLSAHIKTPLGYVNVESGGMGIYLSVSRHGGNDVEMVGAQMGTSEARQLVQLISMACDAADGAIS